jgi:hypothetical protein
MANFCTISTISHLYKTYALADSIMPFGGVLHVLLIDGIEQNNSQIPQNVSFYSLDHLTDEIAKQLISKYKNKDQLRWALKPVFLKFLLKNNPEVIYVDNDIFFFNDFSFLFEKLKEKSILLTPHFYESDPQNNQNWLEANFRVGLYNAGFIGVNSEAKPALDWWASCCLYNVKKSYRRGLFDDQKYLDLVPVLFDNVEIMKHKGLNLAGWNYKNYPNKLFEETNYLIFIHFAELSLIEFSKTENPWHKNYCNYCNALKKYKPNFNFKREIVNKKTILNYLYYINWKLWRLFE